MPGEQAPREIVQRGPAFEAAFDAEGKPTKACEGFARAKGVTPADLEVREEAGRRFVYYVTRSESRPTAALLPDICLKIVRDMYFPKNMRWGYRDLRFSRPDPLAGGPVGRHGHPVRHRRADLGPDQPRATAGWAGRWRSPSRATTWRPCGRAGGGRGSPGAGAAHLGRTGAGGRRAGPEGDRSGRQDGRGAVPGGEAHRGRRGCSPITIWRCRPRCSITAMQSHQRYFPLVDEAGALSNRFLYVSNGDPAWTKQITAGNERVLQGRIEDAEFSFEKDKVTGLEAMAAQLDKIVFHVKAGTMKDKTERLVALVRYLAEVTGAPGEAREHALEAARLAKADQVSVMVREFADLEGVMGEKYALMEGHHPEVAQALREQFLPDAAGGVVPETIPGALLATAEKVDNIVAAFACGEPPSGSKDPYGLRRAAAGMVAIAAKHGLRYDVEKLVEPGLRRPGELPRTGGARERWCPKRPPSSWSGWPRRSPTTASAATPWTRCCPPRATSSTCAPGPRRCSASGRALPGRTW